MATSTKQTVATVPVYDYLLAPGDAVLTAPPGLAGRRVKVTLAYDKAQSIAPNPITWIAGQTTYSAITDANGFWQVNVVPTNRLTPSGTYYVVELEGFLSYKINPTDVAVPAPGWASSAITIDVPAALTPAGQTTGNLQVNGTLGVTGAVTLSSTLGVTGLATLSGGLAVSGVDAVISTRLAVGAMPVGFSGIAGDLVVNRGGASPGTGAVFFGSNAAGLHNIFYDGTAFNFTDKIIVSSGGVAITGSSSISGGLTVSSGGLAVTGGISIADAAARLVGGATSLSLRNNANSLDNVLVTDAGAVTIRGGLTLTLSSITMAGAAPIINMTGAGTSQITGGTVGIQFANNAASFVNLLIADGGLVTVSRNSLAVGGDAGSGTAAQLTLTNAVGIGNGANTNMQSPLKGTGGGPTSAILVTDWIKIYDGATTKWIPAFT